MENQIWNISSLNQQNQPYFFVLTDHVRFQKLYFSCCNLQDLCMTWKWMWLHLKQKEIKRLLQLLVQNCCIDKAHCHSAHNRIALPCYLKCPEMQMLCASEPSLAVREEKIKYTQSEFKDLSYLKEWFTVTSTAANTTRITNWKERFWCSQDCHMTHWSSTSYQCWVLHT